MKMEILIFICEKRKEGKNCREKMYGVLSILYKVDVLYTGWASFMRVSKLKCADFACI